MTTATNDGKQKMDLVSLMKVIREKVLSRHPSKWSEEEVLSAMTKCKCLADLNRVALYCIYDNDNLSEKGGQYLLEFVAPCSASS